MKTYTHLSNEQRYHIYLQRKAGVKASCIARQLGVSGSTVSRELKRNAGERGYRHKQAGEKAAQRRSNAPRTSRFTGFAWQYITHLLCYQKWSPEQIHGALTAYGWQDVPSHERIYQYIYRDKRTGGTLHTHLRHQKTYRKRQQANRNRRGQLTDIQRIHL